MMNRPPLDYLVDGLLVTNTLSITEAESGSYKSFLMLGIGYAIATGSDWMGRSVTPGTVVYVLGEGGDAFGQRMRALQLHHGVDFPDERFLTVDQPLDLGGADPPDVTRLLRRLSRLPEPPRLMCFDTLSQCASGIDENNAKEMSLVRSHLQRIMRELPTHVNVVHHVAAATGTFRGIKVLPDAAQTRVGLKRVGKEFVQVRCEKQKDGRPFEPFNLVITEISIAANDEKQTSAVLTQASGPCAMITPARRESAADKRKRQLLDVLATDFAAEDGATASEWAAKCFALHDIKPASFYDAKSALLLSRQIWADGTQGDKGVRFLLSDTKAQNTQNAQKRSA